MIISIFMSGEQSENDNFLCFGFLVEKKTKHKKWLANKVRMTIFMAGEQRENDNFYVW